MLNKKITAIILSLCILFSISFSAGAKEIICEEDLSEVNAPIECGAVDLSLGADLQINAKSAILMEPYTGEILYEQNPDEILPPASITKIMSLLLIMEAIEKRELTPEEVITCDEYASSMGGSQIWLKQGESMTVDDLLKATVIASANDATVALAQKIAGSEETFVSQMNKKAKELGMKNTTFKNCTGLDAEGHLTTARDVALMSCELIKYPLIKKYSTVWMDTLRDGQSELVNTNKLVRFYEGTTGLKTGTTSGAGYCLSATAKRDGTEYVAVIMGGNTSNDRFAGAKKLLDFGFANYKLIEASGDISKEKTAVSVKNGTEKFVLGKTKDKIRFLARKQSAKNIKQNIILKESLTAPVKKGDTIGTLEIYIDKEKAGEIPIKAEKTVEKLNFRIVFSYILSGLLRR